MKVWITKYALTKGIWEIDGFEITETKYRPGEMIFKVGCGGYWKPDWHDNEQDALKKAEEMRLKKIETLKRQINKLEHYHPLIKRY